MAANEELDSLRHRVAELEREATDGRQAIRTLESVLLAVPAFVCTLDANERFTFVNRTLKELTLERILGASVYEFQDPSSHEVTRDAFRKVMTTGETVTLESAGIGPGGSRSNYVTYLAPLVDAEGRPGVLLVAFDVTEQVQRQRKLAEQEASLNLAVEATGLGLWSWDMTTGVVIWNDRMHGLTGLDTPVALDAYLELVHPDDVTALRRNVDHILQSGVYDNIPHRIVRKDGSVRWVSTAGSLLRNDRGEVFKVVGSTLDITEQRTREAELRHANKMEAVGQLASGIAHNFNNMLTAILPTLDLVGQHAPAEDVPLVEGASLSAHRAAEMVRQLMAFAGRPRSASVRTERAEDIAQRAVALCRPGFSPHVRIEEVYEVGDGWLDGSGDIEQALVTVLLNAKDALGSQDTPSVRVAVDYPKADDAELAAVMVDARLPLVRFRVADNGRGMSEEVRQRIFEPFFTTKAVGQGTGLGLSTAYAIAIGRGGSLVCRSRPGAGAVFDLVVPQKEGVKTIGPLAKKNHAPEQRAHTLALVDDEPTVRTVVRRVLESAGHRVLEASTVKGAIELLSGSHGIELVLLDRSLPDGTGRKVLEALPSLRSTTKVVLFSGQDVPEEELAMADGVLQKPARVAEVLAAIRLHLGD